MFCTFQCIKYCTSFNTFITKLCCYYNELFYILFSKCYLLVERSKTDFYVLTCILCNLAKFTFQFQTSLQISYNLLNTQLCSLQIKTALLLPSQSECLLLFSCLPVLARTSKLNVNQKWRAQTFLSHTSILGAKVIVLSLSMKLAVGFSQMPSIRFEELSFHPQFAESFVTVSRIDT